MIKLPGEGQSSILPALPLAFVGTKSRLHRSVSGGR